MMGKVIWWGKQLTNGGNLEKYRAGSARSDLLLVLSIAPAQQTARESIAWQRRNLGLHFPVQSR